MNKHRHLPRAAACAAALLAPLLLQGCHAAMTSANASTGPTGAAVTEPADEGLYSPWPLKFRKHNLGIHCFDTYGCKVVYDGRVQVMDDPNVLKPSSASIGPDYRKNWLGGRLGFRNFPPPAKVTWRSKDGEAHETEIDFGEIFADELVRHNVARDDIPSYATFGDPDIHLEINNRTISVYMLASVPLKEPRIPGNRYSDMQEDLILIHSTRF